MSDKNKVVGEHENRDPLTGEKGSHPVGTGLGAAAAGAATGAAGGAIGGPVGAAVGAVVGAVVGGLAGKGVAEGVNPTTEGEYWKSNHAHAPYATAEDDYDHYEPAYRYGWESKTAHSGKSFSDVEADLGKNWSKVKGKSSLEWDKAKHATRAAWDRLDESMTRKG